MNEHLPCPDVGTLQHLMLGQIESPEAEHLEEHLACCGRCIETVHKMQVTDTLVEAIRLQAGATQQAIGAQVQALMDRLCVLPLSMANLAGNDIGASGFSHATPPPWKALERPSADPPPSATQEISDLLGPAETLGELGRLGQYRVLKVLESGGMGVVFQAEDLRLKRLVALKIIKPDLAATELARQRFFREAQATAAIEHDHIVTVHQVGEDRGVLFLAMPLLKGNTLEERMLRPEPLPLQEILRVGREVAEGLGAAHERGLVHRDIKPANIWLEAGQGRVKILDFGLARVVGNDAQLTQTGIIVGTPVYMAPEQAKGAAVDPSCDLFSLGCILYRLCTGRLPFPGIDAIGVLWSLALHVPTPPCELNPEVPQALSDLIVRLLAKNPSGRPSSARTVVEAITAIEREQGKALRSAIEAKRLTPANRASGTSAPFLNRTRKNRTVRPLTVAVAAAALAVVAALTFAIVIRITSSKGEGTITIETVDPDVEVAVKKDGKEVVILDTKTNQEVTLTAGAYEVEFKKGGEGLKLEARNFTLKRGDKVVVRVRWDPTDVDLLGLIDPKRDALEGTWRLEDKTLVTPLDFARLQPRYAPPEEYSLEISAERQKGAGPLYIGLIVGQHRVGVVLDAPLLSGLETIDGKTMHNNETTRKGPVFKDGKTSKIVCTVRKRNITVTVDAETIIDFEGDPARLSWSSPWVAPDGRALFVGSHGAVYHIGTMRLESISGQGKELTLSGPQQP